MSQPASSAREACPGEGEVLALICGQLEPVALAALLAHTETCASCALVVAEAGLALGETESFPVSRTSARPSRSAFVPGQLVAERYQIERRVGRGGMGEVYAAIDRELHDRVALKTISPAFAVDPQSVDRFKQELRLARRISHPSVCRVLEFGRHELEEGGSQCFFTLQFIEGMTLRRHLLERGPCAVDQAIALGADLADGLQAIHAQNVVHRDVKPENVMLPAEPRGAAAVWVDFGLARVDLRDTRSGGVVAGTPDYAAPELLRGDVASRASDIYAFGVVLFELLTGTLPFPRSASFSAANARPRTTVAPPSAISGDVPPALDALVLECLEVAPGRRPVSAETVATRLRDIASSLRDAARADPAAGSEVAAPTSRLQWGLTLAVMASAVLAGYAVHAVLRAAPEPASEPLATPLQAPPALAAAPAIALDPPSPQRRPELKRAPAAPASSSRGAVSPPPAEPSSVTDFGGRR